MTEPFKTFGKVFFFQPFQTIFIQNWLRCRYSFESCTPTKETLVCFWFTYHCWSFLPAPEGCDYERMALHGTRARIYKNSDMATTLTKRIECILEDTGYGTLLGKVAFQVGHRLPQEKVSENRNSCCLMTWRHGKLVQYIKKHNLVDCFGALTTYTMILVSFTLRMLAGTQQCGGSSISLSATASVLSAF